MYYLRQRSLKKKWDKYKKKPDREQLLERAATIVAQWIQFEKDVFYSCVKASLDSMALEVLNCLKEKHPDHSIFSTSDETFSYWKNNNIDDNHWNETEGTQIMDTLQEHIFGKLNFQTNTIFARLGYKFIDNALRNKLGNGLIVCIIYQSVARRLGLRCDVIKNAYSSFFIFWKPKYATHNLENIRCFTICENVCEKFPDCLVNEVPRFTEKYSERSFLDNFLRTANNRMWYEVRRELEDMMDFLEIPFTINLIDHKTITGDCQLNLRFKEGTIVIPRSEDVKFAVGMIVRHRDQFTDSCTGVIIGWHRLMDSHVQFSINQEDCDEMDMSLLPLYHDCDHRFEEQQTNYIILTDKSKMCYVKEDTITLTTPKWIENSEIGRYFCKFEGTHYVPNKMLASIYPQDAAITAAIIAKSEN